MQKHKSASITKNTLFLYIRMLFTLSTSLFTSRVILDSLGVEDYGIYNVVGGFVLMFNVFCAGLSTTTQRFLSYDLGKGDETELNETFSACVHIFLVMSLLIVLLAEIGGIWFLENKLVIPSNRMTAAKYVFQFSLCTLVFSLISVPYNALIIVHEKMKAFAYISVLEVAAKLIIAYLIYLCPVDKLIVYAILLAIIQLFIRIVYTKYCQRNFNESHISWHFNIKKIKQIYSFAGWAMFGGLASIGFTQGLNILLNIFFGPTVNSARAIAVQIQNAINSFVLNFQTAINPRIIKAYAEEQKPYMFQLVFASSKFSFILFYALSLPILLETHQNLTLWLKSVPDNTETFIRIIILTSMVDAMANPFMRTADATGKIKTYQLTIGTLLLSIVPVSYLLLKCGMPPYSVFIAHLGITIVAFMARLYIVKTLVNYSIKSYIKLVVIKVCIVTSLSTIIPFICLKLMEENVCRLIITTTSSLIMVGITTYIFALTQSEKTIINQKLKRICLQ